MSSIVQILFLLSLWAGAFAGPPMNVNSGQKVDNAGLTNSEITYLTALFCVVFALIVLLFMFAAVTYRLRLYWRRSVDRNQLLAEPIKTDNVEINLD